MSLLSLLALGCLLGGGVLLSAALAQLFGARALWRARPVTTTECLRPDVVGGREVLAVSGTVVVAAPPAVAPVSGEPAAFFHVVVARGPVPNEWRRSTPTDDDPDVLSFAHAQRFDLQDAAGRIAVDVGANPSVSGARVLVRELPRLTVPLDELLRQRLHRPGGAWGYHRAVRATEVALVDGARATVLFQGLTPHGRLRALHITTERPKVIALRTAGRALLSSALALALLGAWWVLRG